MHMCIDEAGCQISIDRSNDLCNGGDPSIFDHDLGWKDPFGGNINEVSGNALLCHVRREGRKGFGIAIRSSANFERP